MGEEVKMSEYEINGGEDNINGDDERVDVWEIGLPAPYDLTPLSQPLIPPELASAFSISPEPHRTPLDVNRASQNTLSNLRGQLNALSSNKFKSFNETTGLTHDPTVVELEEEEEDDKTGEVDRDGSGSGSEARKWRRIDSEEADSALRTENSVDDPSSAGARTLKRPRLVWTPQLHKRFVDVVGHLGIKNAVPKTIMQWMNVEGLTRENVASHLQKYRLYLKRKQGLSNEGPSASDQLFASTPVPQSLHESGGGSGGSGNGNFGMPIPMPYHHPATAGGMMPMPVYGHMGMQMVNDHVHNNNSNNHPASKLHYNTSKSPRFQTHLRTIGHPDLHLSPLQHSQWPAADVTTASACAPRKQPARVASSLLFSATVPRRPMRTRCPLTPARAGRGLRTLARADVLRTTARATWRPTSPPRSRRFASKPGTEDSRVGELKA